MKISYDSKIQSRLTYEIKLWESSPPSKKDAYEQCFVKLLGNQTKVHSRVSRSYLSPSSTYWKLHEHNTTSPILNIFIYFLPGISSYSTLQA